MTKVPYLTPVPDPDPERDPAPHLPGFAPQAVAERCAEEVLVVDVSGFEGPLDLLLTLSRTQKVDLMQVSVLELADQYLAFV
ncbi:segregation/condensation protein A, partial [Paracoccus sp. PXZ]